MTITTLASSSKGNCYRVEASGHVLLLEAGIPIWKIQRGLGFRASELDGVLISHGHRDHACGVPGALFSGLDVYMTGGTAGELGLKENHRLHIIKPYEAFKIGPWHILPFAAMHDSADPVGYLIGNGKEKLLFLTDSHYCADRFTGLTDIMLEINFAEDILTEQEEAGLIHPNMAHRVRTSHMSLERAKELLGANDLSKVVQITLIHLSASNSDAMRFQREVQELTGIPTEIAQE